MRTYLNTLLYRKRGEYGPLWLFELDEEVWAIVWRGWLEDEDTCYAILSEDAQLFKREWGRGGRRPNPTYRTRCMALEEIIRSLQTMKADLKTDDAAQRKYALYVAVAEHDLHQALMDQEAQGALAGEPELQVLAYVPAALEPAEGAKTFEPSPSPAESKKTPSAAVTPAAESMPRPKPWENASEQPKGLNFQPDTTLHAKMNWVCDNVPKMSRLRILRDGAMAECDRLIELHYKG